jgi:hypothetical protein
MSNAYTICVETSVVRVHRAEDRCSTQLDVLPILPPEQMAALLAEALKKQGYREEGQELVKETGDVTIRVDTVTGTLSAQAVVTGDINVTGTKTGRGYDDAGPHKHALEAQLREELESELEKKAQVAAEGLQTQATDKLEGHLLDVRREVDGILNQVTAEALKIKAAQLGEIQDIKEDPQAGTTTIVVKV